MMPHPEEKFHFETSRGEDALGMMYDPMSSSD